MSRLLVIDDEALILETIRLAFPDYQVSACGDAESGIAAFLETTPDVVLCDIRLPDMSGMELFEKLHRVDAKVPIIVMTGYGSASTAIEATLRGVLRVCAQAARSRYADSDGGKCGGNKSHDAGAGDDRNRPCPWSPRGCGERYLDRRMPRDAGSVPFHRSRRSTRRHRARTG